MIFYQVPCMRFERSAINSNNPRQRFVEWQHPDNERYLDLSQGELLRLAKESAENQENLNVKIKTRRSDEVWYRNNFLHLDTILSRNTLGHLERLPGQLKTVEPEFRLTGLEKTTAKTASKTPFETTSRRRATGVSQG